MHVHKYAVFGGPGPGARFAPNDLCHNTTYNREFSYSVHYNMCRGIQAGAEAVSPFSCARWQFDPEWGMWIGSGSHFAFMNQPAAAQRCDPKRIAKCGLRCALSSRFRRRI